jgi:hypothetical protein
MSHTTKLLEATMNHDTSHLSEQEALDEDVCFAFHVA